MNEWVSKWISVIYHRSFPSLLHSHIKARSFHWPLEAWTPWSSLWMATSSYHVAKPYVTCHTCVILFNLHNHPLSWAWSYLVYNEQMMNQGDRVTCRCWHISMRWSTNASWSLSNTMGLNQREILHPLPGHLVMSGFIFHCYNWGVATGI